MNERRFDQIVFVHLTWIKHVIDCSPVDLIKMDFAKYFVVLVVLCVEGGETGGHGEKHQ